MKIQNYEELKDSKSSLTESKVSQDNEDFEMPDENLPTIKIFDG
jgi:hypothetical protein